MILDLFHDVQILLEGVVNPRATDFEWQIADIDGWLNGNEFWVEQRAVEEQMAKEASAKDRV